MIYEYDYVTIDIDEQKKQVLQMGLGDINELNAIIKEILNDRAKSGWEPLYPFSVPQVWFRRKKNVKRDRKIQ